MVTIDTILETFAQAVAEKKVLPPAVWLDGATKLVVLSSEIDDAMLAAEVGLARAREELMAGEAMSYARAREKSKALPVYAEYMGLRAKRKQVDELVMILKKRATLEDWKA